MVLSAVELRPASCCGEVHPFHWRWVERDWWPESRQSDHDGEIAMLDSHPHRGALPGPARNASSAALSSAHRSSVTRWPAGPRMRSVAPAIPAASVSAIATGVA